MNDIALCLINEASRYRAHCDLAARELDGGLTSDQAQFLWGNHARWMAQKLERDFGDVFSEADIREAASDLRAYYADHIREIRALDTKGPTP